MNRPKLPRALVVGPDFPYPPTSGGVKRTLRLLEAIERAGAEVHYFTAASADPAAVRTLSERHWQIHLVQSDLAALPNRLHQHVRLRPGPWSRNLAAEIQCFCTQDAAFLQAEHVQYEGYLRQFTELPRVLSTHNIDSHIEQGYVRQMPPRSFARARFSYRTYRYSRAEKASGRTATAVLCVSNDDATYYRQYARNVIMAPNGVDDDFFRAGREKRPVDEDVLFFGLMRYDPNAEGLVRFLRDGWPHVMEGRPNARLLIAGEGAQERLGSLKHDSRVSVLGVVEDIAGLVARAGVVVVPVWRGSGTRLKVLEALAAGRPIVGTSLGVSGIGFEHGVHGVVADDPREMALAVADLCSNPTKAEALGKAGPALAEQYRWRRALEPAESLYRAYVDQAEERMRRART
jgi:glycosyltransferase involved in cell wall biosynthesis